MRSKGQIFKKHANFSNERISNLKNKFDERMAVEKILTKHFYFTITPSYQNQKLIQQIYMENRYSKQL
jgi:hypothetical protein